MNFSSFNNRYEIEGILSVDNIHVGSGRASGSVDAPTIRYSNGLAYIPGSSFRGQLRSKLEGLIDLGLKLEDRGIDELDIMILFGYTNLFKTKFLYGALSDVEIMDKISERLNMEKEDKESVEKFRSRISSLAGKIHIEDLVINNNKKDITRDGIAIDRNTGTTKKSAKFDYNVIEDAKFNLKITVENAFDYELELLNIAFNMMKEDIFGGKTSRGIGRGELSIGKVSYIDKENSTKEALKNYLLKGKLTSDTREALVKSVIKL